jgi:hypothetical protein
MARKLKDSSLKFGFVYHHVSVGCGVEDRIPVKNFGSRSKKLHSCNRLAQSNALCTGGGCHGVRRYREAGGGGREVTLRGREKLSSLGAWT